jgi:hypothetical protein
MKRRVTIDFRGFVFLKYKIVINNINQPKENKLNQGERIKHSSEEK